MTYNNEIITYNECRNYGDRVYTYFDDAIGAMEAFGYSAFIATKLVKDVLSLWDDKVGLPCVVLRKQQMDELLKNGEVDAKISSVDMVRLNLAKRILFEKNIYDKWLDVLKARKVKTPIPLQVTQELDETRNVGDAADRTSQLPFFGTYKKNVSAVFTLVIIVILITMVILAMC